MSIILRYVNPYGRGRTSDCWQDTAAILCVGGGGGGGGGGFWQKPLKKNFLKNSNLKTKTGKRGSPDK